MANILVVGGTRGLGAVIAEGLKRSDDVVCAVGTKDCDITDKESIDTLYHYDMYFDVIINFAGITAGGMFHKTKDTNIQRMIDTNINGSVNLVHRALPGMRERHYGRIILASSILSVHSKPGTAIYGATKSFLETFARGIALENALYDITCNVLRLGYFDAGMTHTIPNYQDITKTIPAQRFGHAREILPVVRLLIDSPYINGAVIPITGGL